MTVFRVPQGHSYAVGPPETFRHRTVVADLRQLEAIRHPSARWILQVVACENFYVWNSVRGLFTARHLLGAHIWDRHYPSRTHRTDPPPPALP